jgi:hypothetical protein
MLPIVLQGQVYYHSGLNEYLVVTKALKGDITYAGPGIKGHLEIEDFLERFQPVDVRDLDDDETKQLEVLAGSPLLTGYVSQQ